MSSANGLIALLEEPQNELKKYALEQLNNIVPENWAEVAYSIQKVYVKEPKKKKRETKIISKTFNNLLFIPSKIKIFSELLCEDEKFEARQLAALVASKVNTLLLLIKSDINEPQKKCFFF